MYISITIFKRNISILSAFQEVGCWPLGVVLQEMKEWSGVSEGHMRVFQV
jgi:hypothetical protein